MKLSKLGSYASPVVQTRLPSDALSVRPIQAYGGHTAASSVPTKANSLASAIVAMCPEVPQQWIALLTASAAPHVLDWVMMAYWCPLYDAVGGHAAVGAAVGFRVGAGVGSMGRLVGFLDGFAGILTVGFLVDVVRVGYLVGVGVTQSFPFIILPHPSL